MRNLALQYLNHANANPTIPLTDIPEEEEPAEILLSGFHFVR